MPDNKVDPKITDRSAKDFSKSIESGELYKELQNKDAEENDDKENGETKKRKTK